MARGIEKTVVVDASPETVFSWTADWGNRRRWMGESLVAIKFVSAHTEKDPVRAGMVYKESRRMGRMTGTAKVTVERHRMDGSTGLHEAVCGDGCNRWVFTYRFEPAQDGRCRVRWMARSAPARWWARVLDPLTAPMMVRMMEKCESDHLDRLKRLVEADVTTSA